MFPSQSYSVNEGKNEFFFNKDSDVISAQWVLFDAWGIYGTTPVGPDLIYGSSFGIPTGTVPTNQVNQVLNSMPENNPFFLDYIRVYTPSYNTAAPPPNGPLYVGNILKQKMNASGRTEIKTIVGTPSYLQTDQVGFTHDYLIREWIDGSCMILPQLSRAVSLKVSFYISYQKLSYE